MNYIGGIIMISTILNRFLLVVLLLLSSSVDSKFITLLYPLSAFAEPSLFNNKVCHPKITPACSLYPYADASLTQGTVPYSAMVSYFQQVSNGIITPNADPVVLKNSHYQELSNQNREHLTFEFNTKKMTFVPEQDLSPETVQKLFRFQSSLFKKIMSSSDFNDAKRKYYEQRRFNRLRLNFEREILLPTDWRSLIHPPLFSLNDMDEKPFSNSPRRNLASVSPFWSKDYHLMLDSETRTELTSGNQLRLMVNQESYSEKIKMVKEAKNFVFVAVMSFAYTEESKKIINALIEKAQQGLDVRVIMEKVWGQIAFRKTIQKLKKGGVKVALADDLLRFGRNQGLFHSKYFVIDGIRGVVGGQNLVDRAHQSTGYNHFNKDTDVRVEGPMLTDMLDDYIRLWERFSRETFPVSYKNRVLLDQELQRNLRLRGSENYSSWLSGQSPGLCRFISQGPHDDRYKISKAYLSTFSLAEKSIDLTTQIVNFQKNPLFHTKWSTKIYQKLFDKAKSGVHVDLVTNGIDGGFLKTYPKTDSPFEKFFTKGLNDITGYLNTLIRRGKLELLADKPNLDVWQHFQYIHSKVAIVDDVVTAIGSYNFETYSAEHSHETAVLCQDEGLTKALKDDLTLTIGNSTPLVSGN